MCIADKPGLANAKFYYLTGTKKAEGTFYSNQFNGTLHNEVFATQEERFDQISSFFINQLDVLNVPRKTNVYIEDYSFGSKGRVFGLAENCGILKHKLWKRGHDIEPIAPTVIKKFAFGKGNAKKEDMYESFKFKTQFNLDVLNTSKKLGSPVSDIVDAYFIAQYGYTLEGIV